MATETTKTKTNGKKQSSATSAPTFTLITDYTESELRTRVKHVDAFISAHPKPKAEQDATVLEACMRFRGKLRKQLKRFEN